MLLLLIVFEIVWIYVNLLMRNVNVNVNVNVIVNGSVVENVMNFDDE
jgi:hypothetical protein